MFKWTYFSEEILRNYCPEDWEQNLNEMEQQTYSQAILQHYGWRSFFVDILEVKVNLLGTLTKNEILNQKYLFPSFDEDYIYASFIGLPRTILDNDTLPVYKPSLDIPV